MASGGGRGGGSRFRASNKALGDAEPDSDTKVFVSFPFFVVNNPIPQSGTIIKKKRGILYNRVVLHRRRALSSHGFLLAESWGGAGHQVSRHKECTRDLVQEALL